MCGIQCDKGLITLHRTLNDGLNSSVILLLHSAMALASEHIRRVEHCIIRPLPSIVESGAFY